MDVCFCCLFQFFSTKPRDWLGRMSLKMTILCWVGYKTLTQSILYFYMLSAIANNKPTALANALTETYGS